MNETQSDPLNPGLPMLDFHSNKSDNILSILNANTSPAFSDHDKSRITCKVGKVGPGQAKYVIGHRVPLNLPPEMAYIVNATFTITSRPTWARNGIKFLGVLTQSMRGPPIWWAQC